MLLPWVITILVDHRDLEELGLRAQVKLHAQIICVFGLDRWTIMAPLSARKTASLFGTVK
jgi:hypothetical protein